MSLTKFPPLTVPTAAIEASGGADKPSAKISTNGKTLRKGEQTRAAILQTALDSSGKHGLESLTIGTLAEQMKMSKSGVFAHFGSREELQLAVLRLYHAQFEQEVFMPSLALPRGLPRLRSMFHLWLERLSREIDSGCIYIGAASEYDDREGAIRRMLVDMIETWRKALIRATEQAIECKQLKKDVDAEQFAFQMYGFMLTLHHDVRLLKRKGSKDIAQHCFDQLISTHQL